MSLGLILVLFAVLLAGLSFFIPQYNVRILAAAVLLLGIGVLVGGGTLETS